MPKAECWWCGDPTGIAKHGMIYLHEECFNEITDMNGNVEAVKEYLEGRRPAHENASPTAEKFLEAMAVWARQCEGTKQLIKKLSLSHKETMEDKQP